MKKIVLALGGNALGDTPEEQKEAVKITAKSIVDLVEQGNRVVVTHGNGPQVGMINLAMEVSSESAHNVPNMPFAECGAMSQGYIGFHLQNAIKNELLSRGLDTPTATIVTQTLVDKNDPAFDKPTKPVGVFYSKEEAEQIAKEKGYKFVEDSGRGYRRVVYSPKPVDILEKQSIESLYKSGHIVIAGGGGGIPVIRIGDSFEGISAVIDKDFTSAKLAELIDADVLFILTAVEKIAIKFATPDQEWLDEISVKKAKEYIEAKEFAEGSMKPKVEAAVSFSSSKEGRRALITSIEKAAEALLGKTGTTIRL